MQEQFHFIRINMVATDCCYSAMVLDQVSGTKDHLACGEIVMAIDPGICLRLFSLNQQSYSYGARFIASAGGGDYLWVAAL